ncbi:MAG: SDR family oxidoreductase [Pseudomonadota bacterium]
MDLKGQTIAAVGGGSGIGKAVAAQAVAAGAKVIISSRDEAKLDAAVEDLGAGTALPVDMTDAASVSTWANTLPHLDHLVISASSAVHGPFADLPATELRGMFDAKFFGPYAVAKAALSKIQTGGSITFFSGVLSRRPGMNCSGLGAVNGAVEALSRGLALELGPDLRVNCLSPGMVRSEAYAGMEDNARERMYAETGASLPVGRVGFVDEAAAAAMFLITNTYTTGVVLDVDGGHMIRQYAQRLHSMECMNPLARADGSKETTAISRKLPENR